MRELTYLLLNLGTIASAWGMLRYFRIRFSYKQFMRTLLLVSLPFIVWDALVVAVGHWSFNPEFTTGWYIGNLVFEEILFFIAVPFVMTVIYLIGKERYGNNKFESFPRGVILTIILGTTVLLLANDTGSYTYIVSLVTLITVLVLSVVRPELFMSRWFWQFQVILFALFILFNSILTSLPIIEYGQGAYLGFRIGTIPIEDFLFNFVLITVFIAVYTSDRRNNTALG